MRARRRSPSTHPPSPIPGSSKSWRRASARSAWSSASTAPISRKVIACSSSPAIRTARATPAATRLSWVREVQDRGAGEIVLNCMTNDGVRRGYDVTQLKAVRDVCDVPLVASGGAGAPEHFVERVREGRRGCRARGQRVSLRRHRHSRSQDHARRVGHRDAPMNTAFDIASVDFAKGEGLVPAIVQDADSGAVLMMAYMNREALEQTIARGRAVFFSRSKQRLWEKGETTGHTLDVVDARARLRPGYFAGHRAPARAGLPQRHPHLLRRRAAQRRHAHCVPREARRRDRAARHRKARGQLHRAPARQGRRRAWRRRSAKKAWNSRWPARRKASTRSSKNPPTCCSTCWCCCARAASRCRR